MSLGRVSGLLPDVPVNFYTHYQFAWVLLLYTNELFVDHVKKFTNLETISRISGIHVIFIIYLDIEEAF